MYLEVPPPTTGSSSSLIPIGSKTKKRFQRFFSLSLASSFEDLDCRVALKKRYTEEVLLHRVKSVFGRPFLRLGPDTLH